MTLESLQRHTLSRTLELPGRARTLTSELRKTLIHASNAGALRTPPTELFQLVKQLSEPPPNVAQQLRARELHGDAYCIVGGEKNQERNRDLPHITRDDDAWFDFSIVVREHDDGLELLAYDFELRFPPGMGTPFLRYDLNLPSHRNDERELRSHLHPGSDDVLVPAPLMSPIELLAMLVHEVRLPANRPKRRDPTAFEVNWFRDTHALASR